MALIIKRAHKPRFCRRAGRIKYIILIGTAGWGVILRKCLFCVRAKGDKSRKEYEHILKTRENDILQLLICFEEHFQNRNKKNTDSLYIVIKF